MWSTLGIFRIEANAILLSGDEVRSYVNGLFVFSEDIVIEGNVTLLVENATIRFIQTAPNQYGITLRNPANGNPRLIVKNSVFQCPRSIKVSLWDNSSAELDGLEFNGSSSSLLELHDYSSLLTIGDCAFYYVELHDFANATVTSSRVYSLSCSENSTSTVSTSTLKRVSASDNCSLDISLSDVEASLSVDDSAQVSLEYSTVKNSAVTASKDSRISLVNKIRFSKVKCNLFDRSSVSISKASTVAGKVTEFTCKDNSTLMLNDCSFDGASFKMRDRSVLKVENSNLALSILESYNSSLVEFLHSGQSWLFSCNDESKALCSNSSFNLLSTDDSSSLHLDRCTVDLLRGYSRSGIVVSNTTIDEMLLELQSAHLDLSSLSKGFFDELSIQSEDFSVVLLDTRIESGWNLNLLGSSNLTFHNSELLNLDVVGSSKVTLWNTTSLNLNAEGMAEVNDWVFLTVNVKDYFGSPVKNANITVTLPDSFVDTALTDDDGEAVFEVLARTVNASGDFGNRDCEVSVYYGDFSSQIAVDLSETRFVSSSVPSPWWYLYVLWGSVAVIIIVCCLAIVWVFRRRLRSKKD
jgi:hypothetical protein